MAEFAKGDDAELAAMMDFGKKKKSSKKKKEKKEKSDDGSSKGFNTEWMTEIDTPVFSYDELLNYAISLVVTHQQGSISLLQRRLKVGYSSAASLNDEMEQAGIVGPFTGSKAREVLVDESYLEIVKD